MMKRILVGIGATHFTDVAIQTADRPLFLAQ